MSFHIAHPHPASSLKTEAQWGVLDWATVSQIARGLSGPPVLVP